MIVAFHSNQICLRGAEVALFDYAHFNETLLGNTSIIISQNNPISRDDRAKRNNSLALKKFRERFPLYLYNDIFEIEKILDSQRVDVFYAIKKGKIDPIESKKRKTVVHAVFEYYEPHGDVYAYISKWLSDHMTGGEAPYVPHMIHFPKVTGDLRHELGIPREATVFGRYGGRTTFNIPFVHDTIKKLVKDQPDIYFLFMNTDNFETNKTLKLKPFVYLDRLIRWRKDHPRIIFLPGTSDMHTKQKFVNTADAMIHAGKRGETFGLAVGEFSVYNKPVITYSGKTSDEPEKFKRSHLEILGKKCFQYDDRQQLENILLDVHKKKEKLRRENWDLYSEAYAPQVVMDKFKKIFLS